MRGDDELLRQHAEEKARQSLRLAAAHRKDASQPHKAILNHSFGNISGSNVIIVILALSAAINGLFVAASLGHIGGLREAVFGGLFWVPVFVPAVTIILVDRKGTAQWHMHMLLGIIATAMLIGLPIVANILYVQLVPDATKDQDVWGTATDYLSFIMELLPYYLLGSAVTAPLTGWLLRRWSMRSKAA
jgi:hypothetical protein